MSAIGDILKQAGNNALIGVMNAKKSGEPLPKALDKIAGIAIAAENEGINIAKETAKNKLNEFLPWILLTMVVIILIILLISKQKTK